jgi:hypothetical protein
MALGRGILRLCSFFFLAVLIIHIVACFFYYVASLSIGFKGTWVELSGEYRCLAPATNCKALRNVSCQLATAQHLC